jgi:hypothetical protein
MRTLLSCTVLLLIAGAAGADEPDRIIIPHGTHFENDVDCATCHEGVEASTAAGERFRPEMDLCADCHDVDDDETCVLCHTNPDEAGDYPVRAYGAGLFSHAAHEDAGLECAACHGDPAGEPVLPAKADCRVCHATADDYAGCAMCHAPGTELVPDTHDRAWVNLHGAAALESRGRCALCHTETGCQECHEGDNVRPRSHHLNYAFEHALDARGKELDCYVCHQDPEYCSSCHAANQVMPHDHSSAGWLNSSGGDHAVEGLFDMESCIACHDAGDQSPSCARCHGG